MKNCNEMVNSLLERREQYETEKRNRRKMLTRTITPLCCMCLVALLGFGAWRGGMFEYQPMQTAEDAVVPGTKDWYGPDEEEPFVNQNDNSSQNDNTSVNNDNFSVDSDSTTKYLFDINEITGTVNAAPLYRDPDLHYNEVWDVNKTIEYLGVDILQSVATMPEGLGLQYIEDHEFTATFENDGTLVEDVLGYNFSGNNGAKLTILASKLRSPYDCIYMSNTDEITDIRIPETDVTIPLRVYAQNKSDSALEYNFYVIDFEYAGNYYRIIGENITSYHLDALIREMVK